MQKILYLCDGQKPDCKKTSCHTRIGDDGCRHTSDIEHAANFQKKGRGDYERYWEDVPCGMVVLDNTKVKDKAYTIKKIIGALMLIGVLVLFFVSIVIDKGFLFALFSYGIALLVTGLIALGAWLFFGE